MQQNIIEQNKVCMSPESATGNTCSHAQFTAKCIIIIKAYTCTILLILIVNSLAHNMKNSLLTICWSWSIYYKFPTFCSRNQDISRLTRAGEGARDVGTTLLAVVCILRTLIDI